MPARYQLYKTPESVGELFEILERFSLEDHDAVTDAMMQAWNLCCTYAEREQQQKLDNIAAEIRLLRKEHGLLNRQAD